MKKNKKNSWSDNLNNSKIHWYQETFKIIKSIWFIFRLANDTSCYFENLEFYIHFFMLYRLEICVGKSTKCLIIFTL